jgi:hypothetical protein
MHIYVPYIFMYIYITFGGWPSFRSQCVVLRRELAFCPNYVFTFQNSQNKITYLKTLTEAMCVQRGKKECVKRLLLK